MSRPRLLELFCGGGGSGVGYHRAGFDVVGVDIKPQPNYPFPFILGDAVNVLLRMLAGEKFLASDGRLYGIEDFCAIHASPPCQRYSMIQRANQNKEKWPDLIEPTRQRLQASGKPYVIENVVGAPLRVDLKLCGSAFGLGMIRHRIFESNVQMPLLSHLCDHRGMYDPWHKDGVDQLRQMSRAMGIDWMKRREEVREAIPPAYTEYIGRYLMAAVLQVTP